MKQFFVFFLIAIFFASFSSFSLVRIKPKTDTVATQKQYSAEETANANWVLRVKKENGLPNADSIYPGNLFVVPLNDTGKTLYEVMPKDQLLKVAPRFRSSVGENHNNFSPSSPDSSFKQKSDENHGIVPTEKTDYESWFWLLLFLFIVCLIALAYLAITSTRSKETKEQQIADLEQEQDDLRYELEQTKNMLPVKAPVLVNREWLKQNNPVGNDITNSADSARETIARIYGKKPDFIAQALVSTDENAVSMGFSHKRTAKTGLDNVVVYLGWNWDLEKNEWKEVGMIASVCSNGFEVSPERVKKMDPLFTSIEIVNKDKHPVVFCGEAVPAGTKYPDLVKSLVVKYHEKNIADLEKAGVVVKKTKK